MKRFTFAVGMLVGVAAQAADYQLQSGPLNLTIPDANASGVQSTLTGISSDPGWVTNVSVTLHIQGGYNGDYYAYLSHATGFAVLLNRPGRTASDGFGYSDPGMNVTFSDSGLTDIHLYGGNGGAELSGTFQPDARNFDPAAVNDTTPRTSYFSSFNNGDANGPWTLFIADMSGGSVGQLQSWTLNVATAVPEPGPILLGTFGLCLLMFGRWSRRVRL